MLCRRGADETEVRQQLERFSITVSAILSHRRSLRGGGDAA
jgi:hypothetical protein